MVTKSEKLGAASEATDESMMATELDDKTLAQINGGTPPSKPPPPPPTKGVSTPTIEIQHLDWIE